MHSAMTFMQAAYCWARNLLSSIPIPWRRKSDAEKRAALLTKADKIKKNGDAAFANEEYNKALRLYEKQLDILSNLPLSETIQIPQNMENITLYCIAAVHLKFDKWDDCISQCMSILSNQSATTNLFVTMYDKLNVEEATKLLNLLNENEECTQINGCCFDVAAMQFHCKQKGKCCAAASISGGLNAIIHRRLFTTNQALDEYLALYPKYEPALLKRSTKNIGNGNLKKAMRSIAKKELNMALAIKALIVGPRCKFRAMHIVTKEELQNDDLEKYKDLLRVNLSAKGIVLLAHIKNHYCLVFGMRENKKKKIAEVLIAKKGQKPKHWVSLHDFLMYFAKSKIYKLFAISSVGDGWIFA